MVTGGVLMSCVKNAIFCTCEKLLDEVSDRVELELYLHSMKSFKENGENAA